MSEYKFIHTDIENFQDYKVEMKIGGDMNISDLITEFEHFLRACGYSFKGELVIEEHE